ncbi:MAG: hypothetical protein KDK70_23095 [Myxococcales bacterium]|nr:hypothetical protein [Myxococcales bacterium]
MLGTTGCYTAELDPALPGVFACTAGDESCPSGQLCVNARCEDADTLPSLTILNPEEGFKDVTRAPDEPPLPVDVDDVPMLVTFQGSNLSLVPASSGANHVFGEGYVAVFVDGSEVATFEAGNISDRNSLTVDIPPVPGPHRIALQARRNDGVDYDNEQALATRLIWLENELTVGMRPFVAIRSPWPGQTFGLEAQSLEVQVMTLNFDLVSTESGTQQEGNGHSHIYYDAQFPPCAEDDACDQGYLGTAKAPQPGESFSRGTILLPNSGEQSATLTAVLRNYDHTIYRYPFGCKGGPLCFIAYEDVEILRVGD